MARSIFHQVGATEVAHPELTTLVNFNGASGANPRGSLITDYGDLFGTTVEGGANGAGTVFEFAKTATGPTTLVSFNVTDGLNPFGDLITDAHGDLFGTTVQGGANATTNEPFGFGTVFEIAKTANGYASTPTTLVSFNHTNGSLPFGSLIADAHGDLFGTTESGGVPPGLADGTVFEIAKTANGYANVHDETLSS
jgi:uncharacterized repeat protein (TIGR03803 family)